ncbi:sulfatase-like hydrolase/transferase [Cohnella panacarvi]|uniref:sulfatase-like hydrolase/transferase n=1 Tax=Cohnella panacarvi TaxID=400776 RepID=UPI00047A2D2C|nr:sulfatase-like hydrolase/transferase [Cohnella panacarvi]
MVQDEMLQNPQPFSLQEQFDQIRTKYELFTDVPSFMRWHIRTTGSRIQSTDKVAIWGAGVHTVNLVEFLGGKVPISFIVDSDSSKHGTELMSIPVKQPEAIDSENITTVIVSTIRHRDEIKATLKSQYPMVKIVDFYDIYTGIISSGEVIPFYSEEIYIPCLDIHLLRARIELEEDDGIVETLYRMLLSYLLDIKELDQFATFSHRYIEKGFSDANRVAQLNNEIEQLLINANEAIRQRATKDIVLLVFDGMRQRDLAMCPSLYELATRSISFRSAYSPSTYTKRSYLGMFNGQDLARDEFFTGHVDGSKSSIFQWLEKRDYLLFQYAAPVFENVRRLNHLKLGKQSVISISWWNVMCHLHDSDAPQFHLIHVMETHFPFICAQHKGTINTRYTPVDYLKGNGELHRESLSQYKEVLSFIDGKIKDIRSKLPDNSMVIVCSDHGSAIGGDEPTGHLMKCKDEYIHVPFIVNHKDLIPETHDELLSMTEFDSMLTSLLESGKVDDSLFTAEVITERDTIYNTGWLLYPVVVKNLGVWINAFKMVRNHTHKYVLFENSDELLFQLPDETTNLVCDPQHQHILQDLRSKITADFSYLKPRKK